MKTAFVHSGGGAGGAFQVGALQRLAEQGIKPDTVYGTSVGALNASGWAYGGIEKLTKLWLDIEGRGDILKLNWWKLPWAHGFYSMAPLRKKLEETIQGESSCEVKACLVDIRDGKVHYSSNKTLARQNFIDSVQASAAIPCIMEPVLDYLYDGGIREQAPLKQAIADGHDTIYVLLCNAVLPDPQAQWSKPSWPYMVSRGLRAIDIMEHEVFLGDIEKCLEYNNLPDKRKIELKVIAPEVRIIDTLEFDPKKIRDAIAQGRSSV